MHTVRYAKRSEIEWINKRYDEVGFAHSDFENEQIVIAELDGKKAGLGRLVAIDENSLELGGIYVFKDFRGKKVASKIVEFILSGDCKGKDIYCLPFEHLVPFYKRYGFVLCPDIKKAPEKIITKYYWCKNTYSHPVQLLILKSDNLYI
jgi:N-acetylglutamate synthase-like GNAT family acetyltransferase